MNKNKLEVTKLEDKVDFFSRDVFGLHWTTSNLLLLNSLSYAQIFFMFTEIRTILNYLNITSLKKKS